MSHPFERENVDIAWCPGCGNFGILKLVKEVLDELQAERGSTVIVSGIGQAAKTPYYIDVNMFGVLHGRALPVATAIKAANPGLTVIAEGGDGDMYGEGGNHFLHAVRRNVNIVHIVHNNMVYGLTKGQASPTSQKGFTTKVQVDGVGNEPFNPLAVALGLKAGFVSRVNIGNAAHAKEVLKAAFLHPGYALVDILQPCVTFNKVDTFKAYKAKVAFTEEEAKERGIRYGKGTFPWSASGRSLARRQASFPTASRPAASSTAMSEALYSSADASRVWMASRS